MISRMETVQKMAAAVKRTAYAHRKIQRTSPATSVPTRLEVIGRSQARLALDVALILGVSAFTKIGRMTECRIFSPNPDPIELSRIMTVGRPQSHKVAPDTAFTNARGYASMRPCHERNCCMAAVSRVVLSRT